MEITLVGGRNQMGTDRPISAPAGARAISAVRVSAVGERDAETATSAPDQRRFASRRCDAAGWELVGVVEDLNVPGDVWEDRKGLWRGVEMIEAGDADVLIFHNAKRLARDVELGFHVRRRVEAAGGWLHIGDVPDGAPATLLATMLGMGQDDHTEKKNYFETAKRNAVEAGKYLAKQPPFGYRRATEEDVAKGKAKVTKQLVKVPREAKIVRELFEQRAKTTSWPELCRRFEKKTGRRMAPATLQHMIANRAYLGEAHYKTLVNEEAHEAIVTPELYAVANQTRQNGGGPMRKTLLATIARCQSCGGPMGGTRASAGQYLYRCSNRVHCQAPASIRADTLDQLVRAQLWAWLENEGVGDRPYTDAVDEQRLADARLALEAAEADAISWASDSVGLPAAAQKAGSEARATVIAQRRAELAAIEAEDTLAGARITLRALWPTLSDPELRSILIGLGLRVEVSRAARGVAPDRRVETFVGGGGGAPIAKHTVDG